jgi:hypothetical protein
MDKSEPYIQMSVLAWPYLKASIDEDTIDYRHQGYCTMHHCLITEGYDGGANCPEWQRQWDELRRDPKAQNELLADDKECEIGARQWIPLLRQDQLQEMTDWDKLFVVRRDRKYIQRSLGEDLLSADSMEQLWLAFVMWKEYGMRWTGSKWEEKRTNE